MQFINAKRIGNWLLHLSATTAVTSNIFSMGRPNYSRWLLVYLANMNMLSETHPDVHEPFSSPSTLTARQLVVSTYHRFQPETRSSGTLIPDVPQTSSNYNSYKGHVCYTQLRPVGPQSEAAPRRMLRDYDDDLTLLTVITSRLMIDLFSLD